MPGPVVEALRLHAHEKDYLPVKGLLALKEAIAGFHQQKDQVQANADCVIVGPGSKELMFLLQLVFYGEIIVPTPCWVSYVPQAQILGKRVSLLHTTFEDKWHISADHLSELLEGEQDLYRPRLLVLNYPGNPDGLTYTANELKDIAKVAREYEIILLSDEIYGQLHHKGGRCFCGPLLPGRDNNQFRSVQVVRSRRLETGDIHLPLLPGLVDGVHGSPLPVRHTHPSAHPFNMLA